MYSKIASYKIHLYKNLYKNQEMIKKVQKFLKQEKVSESLQQQVLEQLEYRWKRNKTLELNNTLNKFHPILYEDVVFAMFENTLENLPMFANVENPFLRIFSNIIQEKCYLRKEVIFRNDDIVSEICIIESGTVSVFDCYKFPK